MEIKERQNKRAAKRPFLNTVLKELYITLRSNISHGKPYFTPFCKNGISLQLTTPPPPSIM